MKSDNIINYIIHQPKDTKILRLDGLGIDVLPTFSIFFKHVEELHIENNNFVYLPPFPPTLKRIYCSNNNLKSLPPLPSDLEFLDCSYNPRLYSLPLYSTSLILNIENTGIILGLFRGTNEVLYDLSLSTRRDIFLNWI
jgi:Leucine-rich repeat (LRR) protein